VPVSVCMCLCATYLVVGLDIEFDLLARESAHPVVARVSQRRCVVEFERANAGEGGRGRRAQGAGRT
jgi:hypothetical protein